jgi:hypothetical protein
MRGFRLNGWQRIGIMLVGLLATTGEAETYRLIGSGTQSCGTWTADRRSGGAHSWQNEQWVVGFISGVGYANERGQDPMRNLDAQAVYGWLDTVRNPRA